MTPTSTTESQWLDLLGEEPTEDSYKLLAIIADWYQERGDAAWGLFAWLYQRATVRDKEWTLRRRERFPVFGPRAYSVGQFFWWWREETGEHPSRLPMRRWLLAKPSPSRRDAWEDAICLWRETYRFDDPLPPLWLDRSNP